MEIKISFTNPNVNAEGINVYRSSSQLDPTNLPAPLATIAGNSTSFSDTTVEKDATYYYIFEVFSGTEKVRSGNISATATFYSGPGNQTLKAGDLSCGYYGLVNPNDFTDWESICNWSRVTHSSRSTTAVQDWLKFAHKGKILFVPRQPIAYANWNNLYAAGLVYGVDGPGPREFNTQTAVNQLRTIDIRGSTFKVRMMRALPDPADFTKSYASTQNTPAVAGYTTNTNTPESLDSLHDLTGSEWNDLMMKLVINTPTSQRGESWERFLSTNYGHNTTTNGMTNSNNGFMEMAAANQILTRGIITSNSYHPGYTALIAGTTNFYWRPVLELM
jgi:hypothetical protein